MMRKKVILWLLVVVIVVVGLVLGRGYIKKKLSLCSFEKSFLEKRILEMDKRLFNLERLFSLDLERMAAQDNLENSIGLEVMEEFVSHLKVYDTFGKEGENVLIRVGKDGDGGYIVPEISLKKADVLLGYGVRDDISFEESFSNIFHKQSYGFDCGSSSVPTKNPLTTFVDECVGTDEFLEDASLKISPSKIVSFNDHIKRMDLVGKKIFIKMDIEGGEYASLPEVLEYSKDITGIALEIHFWRNPEEFYKAIKLLNSIEENFILVHVHASNCRNSGFTTKNSRGRIPRTIELSYINKNLVDEYKLSKQQTHPSGMDMPICPQLEDPSFTILVD